MEPRPGSPDPLQFQWTRPDGRMAPRAIDRRRPSAGLRAGGIADRHRLPAVARPRLGRPSAVTSPPPRRLLHRLATVRRYPSLGETNVHWGKVTNAFLPVAASGRVVAAPGSGYCFCSRPHTAPRDGFDGAARPCRPLRPAGPSGSVGQLRGCGGPCRRFGCRAVRSCFRESSRGWCRWPGTPTGGSRRRACQRGRCDRCGGRR